MSVGLQLHRWAGSTVIFETRTRRFLKCFSFSSTLCTSIHLVRGKKIPFKDDTASLPASWSWTERAKTTIWLIKVFHWCRRCSVYCLVQRSFIDLFRKRVYSGQIWKAKHCNQQVCHISLNTAIFICGDYYLNLPSRIKSSSCSKKD